ncbi:UBX domain-containing protein 1 [Dispira simplex]|nr:UBX domain-containing protein 1 [Dispira simplex]
MANEEIIQTLTEMGFPRDKINQALTATDNQGLQPAMDWLLAHADDATGESTTDTAATPTQENTPVAQSLRCNECEKNFKSVTEAEYHASKTGHTDFAESIETVKPLTAEEKAQRLVQLKKRMAEKKAERLAREAEEERERERLRRASGREFTKVKEDIVEKQILRDIEAKKREKREDQLARQRIKQQIEQDKKERAARREQERLARQELPVTTDTVVPSADTPVVHTEGFQRTRIQIRPTEGPPFTHNFDADAQLDQIYDFVRAKTGAENFTLMTTFPRRTLSIDQGGQTLRELGLVPSAALAMSYPY